MSLAEAERAALSELAEQHGMAGAQILIGTVRTNPAAFSQQQNALGAFFGKFRSVDKLFNFLLGRLRMLSYSIATFGGLHQTIR